MALQSTVDINVDFYDKKYIMINAKQYDKKSRFISVTCYNHGELYPINAGEHAAYIKYKKPDNNSVFNFCEINHKGKVLVELTEQMLSIAGICCVDLVIVNKGEANVDVNTGEIIAIDNASILSTMTFNVDVQETPVENSNIESSYEFDGLNDALERAEAEYTQVIRLARSYAIGDADGIREGENTDNAKYYSISASNSQKNAATSETKAATSATRASESATKASTSEVNASRYADNAAASEANAAASEVNAEEYSVIAKDSMNVAVDKADSASVSATNAEYYYNKMSEIIDGLGGTFLPMGTVEYSELSELVGNGTVKAGFLYNISNNFTTDSSFKEGAGIEHSAGENVYFTSDGYWDCLTGATVVGIKGENEAVYRKGNINITADNVGAISVSDIATVDEVVSYLGI